MSVFSSHVSGDKTIVLSKKRNVFPDTNKVLFVPKPNQTLAWVLSQQNRHGGLETLLWTLVTKIQSFIANQQLCCLQLCDHYEEG